MTQNSDGIFNEPASSGCGPPPGPHPHDDPPQTHRRRPRPSRKPRQHSATPLQQSQESKISSALEELHVTKEGPILKEKHTTSHLNEIRSKPLSSDSQRKSFPRNDFPRNDSRSRGPSELSIGSFLTPSLTRPPVQRPRPKKATKSSAPELREVSGCVTSHQISDAFISTILYSHKHLQICSSSQHSVLTVSRLSFNSLRYDSPAVCYWRREENEPHTASHTSQPIQSGYVNQY